MSSKEETIKQKLVEERQKQEALEKAIEAERLAEERRKAAILNEDVLETKPVDEIAPISFQPGGVVEPENWKILIEVFQKKYPDVPVENNVLKFPTREDAMAFFTEQASAEPPRKFLACELNPDGTPSDFHVFSCGDGKLYQGTLEEIQEQLKAAQLENADDPNIQSGLLTIAKFLNPAQGFKESLQKTKDPEDASNEQKADSGMPNPLSTTPRANR